MPSLVIDDLVRRTICHPVYGGTLEPGFRPIPGYSRYTVDENCRVIGPCGKIRKTTNDYRVHVRADDDSKKVMRFNYHLALLAFYPDVTPLDSVDHIDEDYRNNHITNLQWMTRGDNSRKSKLGVSNNSGPAQSKPVWLLDGFKGVRMTRYKSATSAALEMEATTGKVLAQGHISRSAASTGRLAVQGYFFAYEEQPDLPDEEWRTSATLDHVLNQVDKSDDEKIKVSSFGRIRNSKGIKKRGYKKERRSDGLYRVTCVNGVLYYDHQLIFMGWYNKLAPGIDERDENGARLVICHDDTAPKDESNGYRNWPRDLKIGTQKENIQSHHDEKRRRKRKRDEEEETPPQLDAESAH